MLGENPNAPMTRLANRCYGNPLPDGATKLVGG